MTHHLQTVIIYHGKCPDGFGGAFAAWKKFGETAEYIPAQHGHPIPAHMDGRDVYLVDFCFNRDGMDDLAAVAKSVTVLDHHEGIRDVATSFPGVFDSSRSGATISWAFFHPDTSVPFMLQNIEDYDLYRHALPDSKALDAYLSLEPYTFERWDELMRLLEDPSTREQVLSRGRTYAEHSDKIVGHIVDGADLVEFEGHRVYLSGTAMQNFANDVGHLLALKQPPFALIVRPVGEGLRVSLRGDGTIDVAELARRHGGNGHPNAAAFRLAWGDPIPWKPVPEDNDNSRH